MQALESQLEKLAWSCSGDSPDASVAIAALQDIRQLVSECPEDQQLVVAPILLGQGKGLLRFVDVALPVASMSKAREIAFDLIKDFVKSNVVKIATFGPVEHIVMLKLQTLDADRLKEYNVGKASQTVRGSILRILGTLSDVFPEQLFDKSPVLQQMYLEALDKQFRSQKPDMQVITGAFLGLRSFLLNLGGDFASNDKNVQTVYNDESTFRFFFKTWVLIYVREVAKLSEQLPLISGFYKLMTIAAELCERAGLYHNIAVADEEEMQTEESEARRSSFMVFSKFLALRETISHFLEFFAVPNASASSQPPCFNDNEANLARRFFAEPTTPDDLKRVLISRVAVLVIERIPLQKLEDLMVTRISSLMGIVAPAEPRLFRTQLERKADVVNRICAYQILQSKEQFYTTLFFKESPEKGEMIWENIIDTETQLSFEVETNFPNAFRQFKWLLQEQKKRDSVKYISSQYLQDSSLSQDLSYLGSFFQVDVKASGETAAQQQQQQPTAEAAKPDKAREVLELDRINRNPCMQSFLHLIDTMTSLAPECAGAGSFHYFLRDICITVLRWVKEAETPFDLSSPDDKKAITDFINHLMRNSVHEKREIVRSNVEIIKQFVEHWRGYYTPYKRYILDMLAFTGKNDKSTKMQRLTGLQLLGAIVANGLPAYDRLRDVDVIPSEFKFFEITLENLFHQSKDVHEAAAEVCGLILKNNLERGASGETSPFERLLRDKVTSMFVKSDVGLAITTLSKISLHFTPFLRDFFVHVFAVLPRVVGEYRTMALELVRSCAAEIPDLYKHLQASNLDELIRHRDTESQRSLLEILKILLPTVPLSESQQLVATMGEVLPVHPDEKCRELFLDILCSLYSVAVANQESTSTIRPLLVGCLTDSSEPLRKKALNFWDNDQRLSAHLAAEDIGIMGVRATQAPMFSATLAPVAAPSGVADMDVDTGSQGKRSALMFNFEPFKAPLPPSSGVVSTHQPEELRASAVDRVRRRFTPLPTQEAIIMINVRKQKAKDAFRTRQATQRAAAVTLFRKYRTGELPDIQIKLRDIMEPLSALSQRDSNIARSLFSAIFSSVLAASAERSRKRDAPDDPTTVGIKQRAELAVSVKNDIELILPDSRNSAAFIGSMHNLLRSVLEAGNRRRADILDFIPSPDLVGKSALRSGSLHTGVLLLEEIINASAEGDQFNQPSWANLAKLYREMKENDAVTGIYEKKFSFQSFTKRAVECELVGDFQSALQLYEEATALLDKGDQWKGHPPTPQETDSWETVKPTTAQLKCLFTEQYVQSGYLDYFVHSHMKLKDRWDVLYSFVDTLEPEGRAILERLFPSELAFIALTRDDLGRARSFIQKAYNEFVQQWARIHPLAMEPRLQCLKPLQRAVEMEEFLDFTADDKNVLGTSKLQSLLDVWRQRLPSPKRDDINAWDDLVSVRSLLFEKISDKFSSFWSDRMATAEEEKVDFHRLKTQLVNERADFCRIMADAARKQHNFPVADFGLKLALKSNRDKAESDFMFFQSLVKFYAVKAAATQNIGERVEKFAKALKYVHAKRDQPIVQTERKKYAQITGQLYKRLALDAIVAGREAATALRILAQKAISCFQDSISLSESAASLTDEALAQMAVKSTLEAMRVGSRAAVDRVPRVVRLLYNYPSARTAFQASLIAVIDGPEGPAVSHVLSELAKAYPQAVYYPLRVSKERMGPDGLRLANEISKRTLQLPLLARFVDACESLQHPEHRVRDWISAMKPLLQDEKASKEEIRRLTLAFVDDCLNPDKPDHGSYNAARAKEWKAEVEKGARGRSIGSIPAADLVKAMDAIVPSHPVFKQLPTEAAAYSKWFSKFHPSDYDHPLEIPGQHGVIAEDPSGRAAVSVAAFEERILVLGSLRKPKRLGMQGDDQRVRRFLVKGGEDLRLDQRVEQVFMLVNSLVASDSACAKNRLSIRTYQVVPLTGKCGLIEWVDGTQPIKAILKEHLDPQLLKRPGEEHRRWLLRSAGAASGSKMETAHWYRMYEKASRDDTVAHFRALEAMLGPSVLRNALLARAASPEALVCMRKQFASSLAALNMASYVLGIGDRHLENFLVAEDSGAVIGIDFGHAFGTATQILPIPELMPFRLTRQLVNVLHPFDSDGLLKHYMAHVLQGTPPGTLVNNRDILLDTLEVFVKEPLINWDTVVMHLRRQDQPEELEEKRRWFPKKKLGIVSKKLDLANPALITATELRESSHSARSCFRFMEAVALGDSVNNVRARVGERCANVMEQVECLLDQATDPNVLGRTGKNGDVAVSSLTSKHVLLYFSGFTPVLAKFYEEHHKAHDFEVVFVSSDRDPESFGEYYGEMPWLALPFEDRNRKAALSQRFKVGGIPTLIVLDRDGNLITSKARSHVAENDIDGFPWMPPTVEQALGTSFQGKSGAVGREALAGKYVGLYFSGHWCGPCRGFTPQLAATYEKLRSAGKNIEIVFVSADNDQGAFDEYYGEMPWIAVPYEDRARAQQLNELFEVEGIPTLVLLAPDLSLVTKDARSDVDDDPEGAEFPWLPKPVTPLERSVGFINDEPVLLLDVSGAADAAPLAEAYERAAVATKEKKVRFVVAQKEGGILQRILQLTGLQKESHPQAVLIDIPDQGGFYLYEGEYTAEGFAAFVDKYSSKSLVRKQLGR
eukprot:m51a1_g2694 DNA-dependent protein kinase catalytic subunit (2648) ;mRNA; r:766654-782327